jgi:hypothetical protein
MALKSPHAADGKVSVNASFESYLENLGVGENVVSRTHRSHGELAVQCSADHRESNIQCCAALPESNIQLDDTLCFATRVRCLVFRFDAAGTEVVKGLGMIRSCGLHVQ